MKNTLFALLIIIIGVSSAYSDDQDTEYTLGLGAFASYSTEAEETHPGFHIHFFKKVIPILSVGVGYEAILGDHSQHTAILLGKVEILQELYFNFGPGIVFPIHEDDEFMISGHFELVYMFDMAGMHMGPMIGYVVGEHDSHISGGIHIGFGF
jgi:hypothetical protein